LSPFSNKKRNKTLLFVGTPLKHSRHFDYWNQPLNVPLCVCYLDCHEAGLCCYLVIHIENLLHQLQLFYCYLWHICWLSVVLYWAVIWLVWSNNKVVSSEIHTAVFINTVIWVVTSCFSGRSRCFRGTHSLHLQGLRTNQVRNQPSLPDSRHFSCFVYSSTLRIEAICSSETSVSFRTTPRYDNCTNFIVVEYNSELWHSSGSNVTGKCLKFQSDFVADQWLFIPGGCNGRSVKLSPEV
jgi:hypothetical protein